MKYFIYILSVVIVLYFGFLYFFDYSIESPKYEVINELSSNSEVRLYDSYYEAYVAFDSNENENSAFSILFNFITGANSLAYNSTSEQLDMTAPVKLDMTAPVKLDMTAPVKLDMTAPVKLDMTTPVKSNYSGMSFVMPENFNPNIKPDSDRVEIKLVEPQKMAVISFSGFAGEKKSERKFKELEALLVENSVAFEEGYFTAVYNGPYTLPFLRKNEVWVKLID